MSDFRLSSPSTCAASFKHGAEKDAQRPCKKRSLLTKRVSRSSFRQYVKQKLLLLGQNQQRRSLTESDAFDLADVFKGTFGHDFAIGSERAQVVAMRQNESTAIVEDDTHRFRQSIQGYRTYRHK